MLTILRGVEILAQIETVSNERFAWPGGYALGMLTVDGECLCGACISDEIEQVIEDTVDGYGDWCVVASYCTDAGDDLDNDGDVTRCSSCQRPITDGTDRED